MSFFLHTKASFARGQHNTDAFVRSAAIVLALDEPAWLLEVVYFLVKNISTTIQQKEMLHCFVAVVVLFFFFDVVFGHIRCIVNKSPGYWRFFHTVSDIL